MVEDSPQVSWLARIASDSAVIARNAASKVLEADLAQTIMILITVAAGVTYGWIEGYVINAQLGGDRRMASYPTFSSTISQPTS